MAEGTHLLFLSATRVQVIGNGKYPLETGSTWNSYIRFR